MAQGQKPRAHKDGGLNTGRALRYCVVHGRCRLDESARADGSAAMKEIFAGVAPSAMWTSNKGTE